MTDQPAARRSNGWLGAAGGLMMPVIALTQLGAVHHDAALLGPVRGAAATRVIGAAVWVVVAVAAVGGWRRGRRPLNRRPVPGEARRLWPLGYLAAVVAGAFLTDNIWFDAGGLLFGTGMTVLLAVLLASRLVHGGDEA